MGVFIGLLFLLLAPGCINYGLVTGSRGWIRPVSLLVFAGLPTLVLIYLCFRQQAFDELTAKNPLSYDYHEDAEGAVFFFLAAPAAVSGIVSSLAAGLVLWLRKRKLKVE